MKNKFLVPAVATICLFLFSACNISVFPREADATAPKHYVLSVETPSSPDAALPLVPFARIAIPSYLDVPQIVTRDGNRIFRSENFRWGEPLARGISRNLTLRCAILAAGKKLALDENSRIQITFERFDGALSGSVELSALYTKISGKNNAAENSRIFKKSVPVETPGNYDAYVDALNLALDALAADIVSSLEVRE